MYFILFNGVVVLVLAAALVGFIFIQVKAPPVWRLSSLALVLMACFMFSKRMAYMDMQDKYARPLQFYVIGLDGLATAGHTNEIHQACKTFMTYPTLSTREEDVSNFTSLAFDTYGKSTESEMTSMTNKP